MMKLPNLTKFENFTEYLKTHEENYLRQLTSWFEWISCMTNVYDVYICTSCEEYFRKYCRVGYLCRPLVIQLDLWCVGLLAVYSLLKMKIG